jgi:cyclic pyranopterin phosphate synthase
MGSRTPDNVSGQTVPDVFGRPLRSLRLSVTDRCNLRCKYCMPEEDYAWLPKETILSLEELAKLADLFTQLGVDKVRLTGGEPLLRRDLPTFVRLLTQNPRIKDLALTTNAVLMADQAEALYQAGLHRVTISLDTLRPDRFRALTRRDLHHQVFTGIQAVVRAGFTGLKFDTVAIKGYNDDEIIPLIEYGRRLGGEVRFIEYMDVGGATDWSLDQVLSRTEILERLADHYGPVDAIFEDSAAPAQRFRLPDGTTFGIIPSTTTPFCATCDRSRVTADGMWYLCLYAKEGIDLGGPLRRGATDDELKALIRSVWEHRKDRGAEERKALEAAGLREARLIGIDRLREDPHLEMHARGG